jgi:hypothetical protein
MGKTIYISDELHEFLNKKYRGDSMDTTIKKLLHLETFQGKIINKQVPRDRLAPIEKYYWPILNSVDLPRKDMQREVGNYLFTTGHFDQFPDELIKLKNTQERWKSRFTSALHALRKQGWIELDGSGTRNWQGGNYRISDSGSTLMKDPTHPWVSMHGSEEDGDMTDTES